MRTPAAKGAGETANVGPHLRRPDAEPPRWYLRHVRRALLVALPMAGALALGLSACGGANPSASKNGSTTSTTHPKHHHASATSTTTSTTTTSTTAAQSSARCQFTELAISTGQPGAGLGHEGFPILFRNAGTSACTLQGYPGVAALEATGTQAQQAQRTPQGYLGGMDTGSTTPPLVTLAPGQSASALVEGTDMPSGGATSCPTYPAVDVTPPTSTHTVRITSSLPGCSQIQVHPVLPGTTGTTT
jgi:hypothetical protein